MKNILPLVALVALLTSGCHSKSPEKPVFARGWIGGEYDTAEKYLIPKGQHSRVYVKQIHAGTPADQAGFKPGDLILQIDDHPLKKVVDLHKRVDATAPGDKVVFHILRGGQPLDLPLTMGRERYQDWHSFSVGGHASTELDVLPFPDFTLFGLVEYKRLKDRMEFQSAEHVLAKQSGRNDSNGVSSEEGWRTWILFFGFTGYKMILSQEPVVDSPHASSGS